MAWQNIINENQRESQVFYPESDEIMCAIAEEARTASLWGVQQQLPNDEWVLVTGYSIGTNAGQPRMVAFKVANGVPTRMYGRWGNPNHYAGVHYYWAERKELI